MKTKSLNQFFKNNELFNNRSYSKTVVKSLIRSVLEPITTQNSKALVYMRLKNMEGIESLIKRIEYLPDVTLNQFGDFEFSKFDSEEVGFIVLTSQRYNCALLFKEIENGKYEIYLKLNSKLVSDVYETLKSIFLIGDDKEFYSHKPERRENSAMNNAVENLLKYFEDTVEESECNLKIQETYKNVNLVNKDLRKEVYQNVKAIAHEIKNQLSILNKNK